MNHQRAAGRLAISASNRTIVGHRSSIAVGIVTALGFFVISSTSVQAAAKKAQPKAQAEDKAPDVPGDDIFGFTSPTDLGDKGELGFVTEFDGRVRKRDGSYGAYGSKNEIGYTFAENWWIGGSGFISHHRIRAVTDLDDLNNTAFDGLSFELQHRLIQRSAGNPFALTLAVEPRWARVDGTSGLRSDAYSAEFKVFVDAVVVPNKVFWAANFAFSPERAQDTEDRSIWLKTSSSTVSTAVAFQLSPQFFVGVEARHLASYDRGWLDDRVGYAIYVGPTLAWKVTDKVVFNATWQPQVAGRSIDNPDLRYDLDNFERAQFLVKLSVALN